MGLATIEQYEVMSLQQMQELHEEDINLVNEIDELFTLYREDKSEKTALDSKLEAYVLNVEKHFGYEEEMMLKYNFPSYDLHKLAHDMFLADMAYAKKLWKDRGDVTKIVKFIRKSPLWIESHMSSVDAPTSDYIAKKIAKG